MSCISTYTFCSSLLDLFSLEHSFTDKTSFFLFAKLPFTQLAPPHWVMSSMLQPILTLLSYKPLAFFFTTHLTCSHIV